MRPSCCSKWNGLELGGSLQLHFYLQRRRDHTRVPTGRLKNTLCRSQSLRSPEQKGQPMSPERSVTISRDGQNSAVRCCLVRPRRVRICPKCSTVYKTVSSRPSILPVFNYLRFKQLRPSCCAKWNGLELRGSRQLHFYLHRDFHCVAYAAATAA